MHVSLNIDQQINFMFQMFYNFYNLLEGNTCTCSYHYKLSVQSLLLFSVTRG